MLFLTTQSLVVSTTKILIAIAIFEMASAASDRVLCIACRVRQAHGWVANIPKKCSACDALSLPIKPAACSPARAPSVSHSSSGFSSTWGSTGSFSNSGPSMPTSTSASTTESDDDDDDDDAGDDNLCQLCYRNDADSSISHDGNTRFLVCKSYCMGAVERAVHAKPRNFKPIYCPVRCEIPGHKELQAAEFTKIFGKSDPKLANEYTRKMNQYMNKGKAEKEAKEKALLKKMEANKGTGKWTKSWNKKNTKLQAEMREGGLSPYIIETTKRCPKCGEDVNYECYECPKAQCARCEYKFCFMCGIKKEMCSRWSVIPCGTLYKTLQKKLNRDYPKKPQRNVNSFRRLIHMTDSRALS